MFVSAVTHCKKVQKREPLTAVGISQRSFFLRLWYPYTKEVERWCGVGGSTESILRSEIGLKISCCLCFAGDVVQQYPKRQKGLDPALFKG